jgi:hypothetical protein
MMPSASLARRSAITRIRPKSKSQRSIFSNEEKVSSMGKALIAMEWFKSDCYVHCSGGHERFNHTTKVRLMANSKAGQCIIETFEGPDVRTRSNPQNADAQNENQGRFRWFTRDIPSDCERQGRYPSSNGKYQSFSRLERTANPPHE